MTEPLDDQWFDTQLGATDEPVPAQSVDATLAMTKRALARRRWLRRALQASVLAACYVAGMLTLYLFGPTHKERVVVEVRTIHSPPQEQKPTTRQSGVALEWQAVDSEKPRPDLYERAGNRYLVENDLESALRCYGQSLAGSEETELQSSDSWLLTTIKNARLREKLHAQD